MVKARNAYLESEGINPFYQESVPKAALKLRQALGRLIRTETDRGVLLILDRRLVTAKIWCTNHPCITEKSTDKRASYG